MFLCLKNCYFVLASHQKKALLTLLCSLKQDYPDAEIVGHCELEGVHKACPSFPVSTLRAQIKQLGY